MSHLRSISIAALAASCVAVFVAGTLIAPPLEPMPVDLFWLVWVGFPVVGAIILIKSQGNPVGLIQLMIGVCAAVSALTTVWHEYGGDPSALALVNQLAFMPVFVLVPLLILIFPSGRPPSPRWRVPIIGSIVVSALLIIWFAVRPVSYSFDAVDFHANPLGVSALAAYDDVVMTILSVPLALFAAATLIQAVISYRRADVIGRLQVKWVIAPAIAMPFVFAVGMVVEALRPNMTGLSNLLVMTSFLVGANGVAAGIGVAVLRHRLYGIDRIVSRTVTYGIVLAVLALSYFAVVTAMTSLVGSDEPIVIAAATLVVAALFNPLRRRARTWVDRRFNRARFDAERVMEEFSGSLRDVIDADSVVGGWVRVTAKTMEPTTVGVWVRDTGPRSS